MGAVTAAKRLGEALTSSKPTTPGAAGKVAGGIWGFITFVPRMLFKGLAFVVEAVGGVFARAFGGSAKVGLKIAEAPITAGLVGARWVVNGTKGIYAAAPMVMWPLTALAAVAGIGGAMRSGAEKRTQQQILEQAAAQQQTMGNPYRLAPGEYDARVAPLMKDGGQQGGFAAAEMAARDAAAAQAAAQK